MKEFTYRFTDFFLFLETADRFPGGHWSDVIFINLCRWNCFPQFFLRLKKKLLSGIGSECLAGFTLVTIWKQEATSTSSVMWGFPFAKVIQVLKIREENYVPPLYKFYFGKGRDLSIEEVAQLRHQ